MWWILVVALTWTLLALPIALAIGRGLRIADRRDAAARRLPTVPDYIPADVLASVSARRHS
jgi:hypothetical protein